MSSSSYSSMLRDARWQRKRLEIMERDDFKCRACGRDENAGITFNVHHAYYEKGKKPWEYDSDMLVTLCSECHASRHALINALLKCAIAFSVKQFEGLTRCSMMPELCTRIAEAEVVPEKAMNQV